MKVRLPAPSDLYVEPALGPLVLLDLAAAVAANALRAQHVEIEGDFFPGETDEITTARVLARECDMLRDTLNEFRRRVLARLARERSDWPF
ncbi:MAG TPA: hypothetical protein VGS17_01715 [Candidatus Limnocylindria bacterium]|nr:hypothetical protein [Candidatus Limnocylindria bacterium]HVS29667.1 hypothetical protein [Solirubrobacteraceae bacterium]